MIVKQDEPKLQGRIDLPPAVETQEPRPQGAIELKADELASGVLLDSEALDNWLSSAPDVREALQPRRMGALGWGLLATTGLSLLQLLFFIWGWFQDSWFIGGLWSIALVLLLFGGGRQLWRELKELRQLKHRQDSQSQARVLQFDEQPDGARQFCHALARQTGALHQEGFTRWQEECELHHTSAEQMKLYSQRVLHEQDSQARARVSRWSGEAAVLVAVSPLASVDMLLVLWRSLKMIDDIAACYGIRLGYWSRIRLLKQIARHMLYAGAAELITDVGLDWLGAEFTAKLSARVAQGVGAGLLTARLGLQTMQVCRPIPFMADERPRLGQIRSELVTLLLSKLGSVLQRTPASRVEPGEPAMLDKQKL
ncbi:MAG: YcjF family protein [Aeromonadaceae bacterium]